MFMPRYRHGMQRSNFVREGFEETERVFVRQHADDDMHRRAVFQRLGNRCACIRVVAAVEPDS